MRNLDFTDILEMTPEELRKQQWKRGWPLCIIGAIVYGVLRLFGQKPKDFKGLCPYFEIGKDWGGLEFGWFFICGKESLYSLRCHELGHGIQNAKIGGLRMLCLCFGSAMRYWYRRIFGGKGTYDSWWFEGQATEIGREYAKKHKT